MTDSILPALMLGVMPVVTWIMGLRVTRSAERAAMWRERAAWMKLISHHMDDDHYTFQAGDFIEDVSRMHETGGWPEGWVKK